MRRALATACLLALAAIASAPAHAAGPAPLSADHARANVSSTYGSGVFGSWGVDAMGMPRYRYTIDQETNPAAAQPELAGSRDAWHQLGNDHIVADAFNHGYTQLWSQDRLYEWANYYDAATQHYGGGYGYLRVDGKLYSTLYDDRAPGTQQDRDFGLGYFARDTTAGGIDIQEKVYAPFGDDPLLLHDVTLRNTTAVTKPVSWFEYWDVNPYLPGAHTNVGVLSPTYDAATHTLSVAQAPHPQDLTPLSIFAASLQGPVGGYETDGRAFFGSGGRANPSEPAADHLSGTLALPVPAAALGHTVLAFRAPLTLRPGQSVTLRYAYGMAHAEQIAPLVARYRSAPDPFAASEQRWRAWLPEASFGRSNRWLARELEWDAYMVRSGATYEECAGRHIISQGGYYQYGLGFQGAFRDPLQHMLPMIYSDPALARDVLLYSAAEQPQGGGQIPYARLPRCARFDLGTSDDLDLWLLLSATEYGLGTRDLAVFRQPVPWSDSGTATLWDHLKDAFAHQESQRGPHGEYISGVTGDWSDLATAFLGMTESNLVAAQAAYVYPQLAELADALGDHAFAQQVRATVSGLDAVERREWTGGGWLARGYDGVQQLGQGVIYGEPQPWGLLSGVLTRRQDATLVANIRRFLTGIGAPGGPSPIGSSQSPAADDPGVTEHSLGGSEGVGDNHAVYVGGSWFAVNGWLTWALGELDGIVPRARAYAFDELRRNTLAAHATAYPAHWDGVISVDDACRSWYSTDPADCGVGLTTSYDTQIMHQPAWSLFDAIRLAGVTPTADGFRIAPHLPMNTFSLRLPDVGVASKPRQLRGYIVAQSSGLLRLHVSRPRRSPRHARLRVYAAGRRVHAVVRGGIVSFDLPVRAGRAANWAVTATKRSRHRKRRGPHHA